MVDRSTDIVNTYNKFKPLIIKVNSRYARYLSPDEMYSCNLLAINKTLEQFDDSKGKFLSYLKKRLWWELCSFIQEEKNQRREIFFTDSVPEKEYSQSHEVFDFLLDCEDDKTREIFERKLLQNMTLGEIAKEMGCCRETVSRRFRQYKRKMREKSV